MSKKQKLTKSILCAVMAASVVSISGNAFAYTAIDPDQNQGLIYSDDGKDLGTIQDRDIIATDDMALEAGDNGLSAVQLKNSGTKLILDNVNIHGGVSVRNGAELTLQNSNAEAGAYYTDGHLNGGTDFKTEGGTFNVINSNVNSTVYASGSDDGNNTKGILTFTNSNVNADKNDYEQGSIVAEGNAEIILNGNKDNTYEVGTFIGALSSEDNKYNGKIEINGGTLIADNLRALVDGSLVTPDEYGDTEQEDVDALKAHILKGGIVLQNEGVIQTKTGQIFANGIDTTSDATVLASKDSGKVTNDYIKYEGGTINFTDIKYSQDYLDSAKKNMADVGKTNINMLGTLVDEKGEVVEDITVDQAVENGNVHVDTPVKANENISSLVVGNGTTDGETQYSNGSFVASQIKVGENTNTIAIKDGQTLGLGGKGGELVIGNKDNLTVTVDDTDSSLTLGREGYNSENILTADVSVNQGSLNSVSSANTVNGNVELDANTQANIIGNSSLVVNGKLTANEGANINIGDKNSAGTLISENTNLNGAVVYLDPIYKDGNTITDGSKAGLVFNNNAIDGKLVVGENSVLSLGTTDTTIAEKAFAKTKLTWSNKDNDVLAAAYINTPQDISKGALLIDKNATKDSANSLSNGTVKFANNSLLMVNGEALTDGKVAISGVESVEIAQNTEGKQDGAKLYIDNAKDGQSYTILSGNGVKATDKWSDNNVIADNILLTFTGKDGSNVYIANYQGVKDVFGNDVVANKLIDNVFASNDEKIKNSEAYKFFNKAASDHYNLNKDSKATALNSVFNMGELAGVNHATYSMSNTMTDSVADHLSIAVHGDQDSDVWAKYIHNKEDVNDIDLAGLTADYDATFNGVVVGSDFYKNGKSTIGIALSYADGDIDGSNIASTTQNDAEYYGVSLYGKIDNGDSAVLGDISFMHSSNDITQYNSGTEITASPDADAFSIGVRAEKAIKSGANGKFVPYIGARYMHLGTADYTNSLGINYNVDEQNLFILPVGVKYSTEIRNNDWTIRPVAEVGYVWTMGDRDVDQTVSLNGAFDSFGFETVDNGSFIGKLGVEAESDKIAYGISYEYQDSDSTTANKWLANVTFKF